MINPVGSGAIPSHAWRVERWGKEGLGRETVAVCETIAVIEAPEVIEALAVTEAVAPVIERRNRSWRSQKILQTPGWGAV